jgi:predicted MPP superfamily phosphohydrolase
MVKILSIGDVHGKDNWKYPINYWGNKSSIDEFDYIVFVGDYVDSFDIKDEFMLNNLLDIIKLRKEYPNKVVLLWGNHDIQYLFGETKYRCTGFRESIYHELNRIFIENRDIFQLAFQYKNYIWSHAGIHRGWYKTFIEEKTHIIRNGEKKDYLEIDKSGNIADILNFCFEARHDGIFNISWHRGGNDSVGGPLWADKNETYKKPIIGYHQIIGHSRVDCVKTYKNYGDDLTSTTYIDCMSIDNDFLVSKID